MSVMHNRNDLARYEKYPAPAATVPAATVPAATGIHRNRSIIVHEN
jgi:hypothetical protein